MVSRSHLRPLVTFLAAGLLAATASAQALYVEDLPGGGRMILVTDANATATSLAWQGPGGVATATAGTMTLPATVAAALGGGPRPALVVAVGAAEPASLGAALAALAPPAAEAPPPASPPPAVEGLLERRLGPPGSSARLQLVVPLPAPSDPRRAAVEVLLAAAPTVLGAGQPGLVVRLEEDAVRLELPVAPELAELQLRRLRLALAQLAAAPRLDRDAVAAAARELVVRRHALLERHPDGAAAVLARWRAGGLDGVRFFLYGLQAVGPEEVAAAAREWLPQHPGQAVIELPPQLFDPRFAPPPERLTMPNDLAVVVLEHATTALAALALQPVLQGDLDGTRAAAVLSRLAVAVRSQEAAPPVVRVEADPARLLLAVAPEELGEALEALQHALVAVAANPAPVPPPSGPRGRALELLAVALALPGAGDGAETILRPDNLALGALGPDAEAAADAIVKFLSAIGRTAAPSGVAPPAAPVLRLPTEGASAALALALPVEGLPPARRRLLAALLELRLAAVLPALDVRVLEPLVPGRPVLVLALEGAGTLPALEHAVQTSWARVAGPVREEELAPLRPRVAAAIAADGSGALGAARRLALAAAGAAPWRALRDLELEVLSASPEDLSRPLAAAVWSELMVTATGPVPAAGLPR